MLDSVIKTITNHLDAFFGGALAAFIYREKIKEMKLIEKAIYCAASVGIGVYGGDGIISAFNIDPATDKAHLISVLTAVFGLAILGLMRDKITHAFEEISNAAIDWVKGKLK